MRLGARMAKTSSYIDESASTSRKMLRMSTSASQSALEKRRNGRDWLTRTLNRAFALERIDRSGSPLQKAVFTRYFAYTRVAVCGIVASIDVCRSWIFSLAVTPIDRTARAIVMSDEG